MRNAKKNKVGPGTYKINLKRRIRGGVTKSSVGKSAGFIDDAEYKAKSTPGFYKFNHKSVDGKVWAPDFKKFSKERVVKLKKSGGLGPGSYKTDQAYNSTHKVIQTTTFLKNKRFVEIK
jgi:hypothetical protein